MQDELDYRQYVQPTVTASERYITMSDGVALRVIEFVPAVDDDRPVVLFVAGWISLISGWKGFLHSLTARYRVVYFETREKSTSKVDSVKKTAFDMPRLVADIAEAVEQTVPPGREYFLSGSSLGATTALEYLMTQNRMPLSTALVAPNAELQFPGAVMAVIRLIPPAIYGPVKAFAKWYLRKFKVDAEKEPEQMAKYENTLDCADPYKLKKNVFALMGYSVWGREQNIRGPLYVVGASSDTLHGLDAMEKLVAAVEGGELVAMESNKATHGEAAGTLVADYFDTHSA